MEGWAARSPAALSGGARWALPVAVVVAATALVLVVLLGNPVRVVAVQRFVPTLLIGAAGIAGWLLALVRPWPRLSPLLAAMSLLLAVQGLSAALSPHPSIAWQGVWHQFAVFGTALLAWRVARHPGGRQRLIAVLGAILGLLCLSYIVEVAGYLGHWLRLGMPVAAFPLRPALAGGLAGIPTWLGDYLVLLTPVVAAAAWGSGRRGRVGAVLLVALAGAILLHTGTRSLWLIAAGVTGILVLVAVMRRPSRARIAAVGAALTAITVLAIALDLPARVARDADAGRSSAFGVAVDIFSAAPVLGTGPWTYVTERLEREILHVGWYVFPSAHNLVLNTLAETGVVGALAALGVLLAAAPLLVRNLRAGGPSALVAAGALVGLTMLALHAHADVVLEVRGLAVLAVSVAGLALWRPETDAATPGVRAPVRTDTGRASTRGGAPALIAAVVGLAVGVVAAVPAARSELAAAALYRSFAANPADPEVALAAAEEAARLDPGLAPAHSRIGRLATQIGDPELAEAAIRSAIGIEGLAQHEIELSSLLVAQGRHDEALAAVDRALVAGPTDPFVRLNAVARFAALAPARVGEELEDLIVLLPEIVPLLRHPPPGFPSVTDAVLLAAATAAADAAVADGRDAFALRLAAWSGDDALARRIAAAMEDPDYRLVAEALAGDTAAAARIAAEAVDAPLATDLPYWAWVLAVRRCDGQEAARWFAIRLLITSGAPSVPTKLVLAPAPGVASLPAGYPGGSWGVGPDPDGYVPGTWAWEQGSPSCP